MTAEFVTWDVREPPLAICGVFATGHVAAALAQRIAQDDAPLDVFISEHTIAAIGDAELLPWVDGATWLGRDGSLLCPTALTPSVSPKLISTAIRRSVNREGLVVSTPELTLLLQRADGQLDRAALQAFSQRLTAPPTEAVQ